MKVAFVINEAHPIYKIGGLGDVGHGLPKSLLQLGIDVRLILPLHPEITLPPDSQQVAQFSIAYDRKKLPIEVWQAVLPTTSCPVYLFSESQYLSKNTDASDNHADKYAVFSLAVTTFLTKHSKYWQPQIVHCHDWHTALIPVLLSHQDNPTAYKTIVSIHNLAFQGNTTTRIVEKMGLHIDTCRVIGWDLYDQHLNILLEGMIHATAVTTVSPTYAQEILTKPFGEKIHEHLQSLRPILGILNGLDYEEFNPETDKHLAVKYDGIDPNSFKLAAQRHLEQQLELPERNWMISFVGRVDGHQKGIDLISKAFQSGTFPPDKANFVFLGTGDPKLEEQLRSLAGVSDQIRVITRFDEALARTIYAGSHLSLIPSLFEPCGLVQMIAMRYGSLPVARAIGGLKDTIRDQSNGFLFNEYRTEAMLEVIDQALSKLADTSFYQTILRQAMETRFTWETSAHNYKRLYEECIYA